jgi:DHA1 family bicyclomycin/chloramphenicol resistance-like MFS transporter
MAADHYNPHPGLSLRGFIALIAALNATNALAIDSMLPALGRIGSTLGLLAANERQWIVTSFLLGFGVAQIFYGTLADRFGRKPILVTSLIIYTICSLAAAFSKSFELMMVARALQGIGAAGSRVLSVAIVRDCYEGRTMARVMSLSFIVFLGVPILAPSLGQLVMMVAPWPAIFIALALYAAAVMLWSIYWLPETLHEADRTPIIVSTIVTSFKLTLQNRVSLGYTLAMTLVIGSLFGFINSAQQIFTDVFHEAKLFPLIFAAIAASIACASLLNASLVNRFGSRLLSHTALLGFIIVAILHMLVAFAGAETIWTFGFLQAGQMFFFGLMVGNLGAMSMEPLGHIAGTAASIQGSISTIGGASIGMLIGLSFNGSTMPVSAGYAVCGVAALGAVLAAEGGRLFRSSHALTAPG